jgi:hypothetical protein
MLQEATHTPILTTFVHEEGISYCLHVLATLHNSDTHDLQGQDNIRCRTSTMTACLLIQLFLERTSPHMLPAASSIFFTLDQRMDGEVRYKVSCPSLLHLLHPSTCQHCWSSLTRIKTCGTSSGCCFSPHIVNM